MEIPRPAQKKYKLLCEVKPEAWKIAFPEKKVKNLENEFLVEKVIFQWKFPARLLHGHITGARGRSAPNGLPKLGVDRGVAVVWIFGWIAFITTCLTTFWAVSSVARVCLG